MSNGFPEGMEQWVTDETYDIRRAYVRSTDSQGHYKSVRVNIPGYVKAQADAIIARDPMCLWRTVPDLFRDALHHRLVWYAEERGNLDLSEMLALERAAEFLERKAKEEGEREHLLELTREQLATAKRQQDRTTIASILLLAEDAMEPMNDHWRQEMERVIEPYRSFLAEGE